MNHVSMFDDSYIAGPPNVEISTIRDPDRDRTIQFICNRAHLCGATATVSIGTNHIVININMNNTVSLEQLMCNDWHSWWIYPSIQLKFTNLKYRNTDRERLCKAALVRLFAYRPLFIETHSRQHILPSCYDDYK